jgi:outer membrane biosynthesis protein TonB
MRDNPDEKINNVEDMALADLLGMAGDAGDDRVQEREDEPGSGIAKLAMLVATTSIEEAKRPSIPPIGTSSIPPSATSVSPNNMTPAVGSVPPGGMIPPPASVPPGNAVSYVSPEGIAPTEAMPSMPSPGAAATEAMPLMPSPGAAATEVMPAMQGYPASMPTEQGFMQSTAPHASTYGTGMQTGAMEMDEAVASASKPKSKIGLVVGVGVGITAVIAVAFLLLPSTEASSQEDTQVAQLQAKLDALKEAQGKPVESLTANATIGSPSPTPAANKAAPADDAAKVALVEDSTTKEVKKEAAAPVEDDEPDEAAKEEKPAKPLTRAQRKRLARAKKAQKKAAKTKVKAKAKAKAKAVSKTKPAKETKGGSKAAAELGNLLDADVASGKKSAADGLPASPSRGDVKSAMRPIQAKASTCAKYSKGTVKLKVVVGSNGRVKSSKVVGGSADGTAANCVAMIARTAKFPAFSNSTFSFNYPVTLK